MNKVDESRNRIGLDVSVAAIVLFQCAALFARSMLQRALIDDGLDRRVAADLSYLVVPPILLILMYPYVARCRQALSSLLQPRHLTTRVLLAGIALGLLLRLLRWCGLTVLLRLGVGAGDDRNTVVGPLLGFACPHASVLLLSLFVMAFLVPVVEEVLNRGFILHRLLPRGKTAAVVVSSLLFTVLHPPSGYAMVLLGGVLFGMQALNFRTLMAPIVAHVTYNAAAVIEGECFRILWNPMPVDPALRWLGAVAAAGLLVGTPLACWLASARAAGGLCSAGGPAAPVRRRSRPVR